MRSPVPPDAPAGSAGTRRGQPQPSLRQRYDEYLFHRIEDYKNSLPREELFRLGNDAVAETTEAPEGQYVLTEMLATEMVDALIRKRLRLPSFARWRQKYSRVREAQREPTHWGLERGNALVTLLPRLEPGDHALVVGGNVEAAVYLLAAWDLRVTCLCEDNPTGTRIETRMAAESLTGSFEALVVMLGSWFPDLDPVDVVVVDAATLADLPAARRLALLARLQEATRPGGVHAVLGRAGTSAPETWLSHYPDWERLPVKPPASRRGTKRPEAPGVLVARPVPVQPSQVSTA
jgi:hypothetical protein